MSREISGLARVYQIEWQKHQDHGQYIQGIAADFAHQEQLLNKLNLYLADYYQKKKSEYSQKGQDTSSITTTAEGSNQAGGNQNGRKFCDSLSMRQRFITQIIQGISDQEARIKLLSD